MGNEERILIGQDHTDFFSVTQLNVHGKTSFYHTGYPQIAIVEDGSGTLLWNNGSMLIRRADELFFPVDIPDFQILGNVKLILANPGGVVF